MYVRACVYMHRLALRLDEEEDDEIAVLSIFITASDSHSSDGGILG